MQNTKIDWIFFLVIVTAVICLLAGCKTITPETETPNPSCCYGTRIPDGYTCMNQATDCINEESECVHYSNCDNGTFIEVNGQINIITNGEGDI